jgi:lipoprotein-releasing system permease protein
MTRVETAIAGRYLRSRRSSRPVSLTTFIAAGGVTVGVMALIVVLGVMNGLQTELRAKILVGSPHLRVLTFGPGLRMGDWQQPLATVRRDPDVVAAAPFVLTQALFNGGHDWTEGAYLFGVESDTGTRAVTGLARTFQRGDLSFTTTQPEVDGGVVVGRRFAERMSAFPGTVLTVVSFGGTRFNAAVGGFVPKYWRLEVTGYFETGMYEYDNAYVVTSRALAQQVAGLGDAVTGLEVRLRDPNRARAAGTRLEEQLGYPYRALDWQTQNAQLFSALQLEKLGMGFAVLLIVVVAAFNIVSMLTMVVADKTREIGILRAMGLPTAGIRWIFVLQGAAIGLVGTVLGTALGLALARVVDRSGLIRLDPTVYFIDHLPVRVNPVDLTVVVAASLVVALVATLHPAGRAAALDPVEAIRHQ